MVNYEELRDYATERQTHYIDALKKYGSQRKAANGLGINKRTMERALSRLVKVAVKQGFSPAHDMTHAAPQGHFVKGVSSYYGQDGELSGQWVKTQVDREALEEGARLFMDEFCEDYRGKSKLVKSPKNIMTDLLTIYPLGDPHFGMLAWEKTTGIESYDTNKAASDLTAAIEILVKSAPPSRVGVLANMGDLFHSDNLKSLTTAGTPIDTDGRMSHTIDVAARVFRQAIDLMLTKHAEVRLINVRGNHDEYSSLFFNKLMMAFYENNPRVSVVPNETKLITLSWGKVFLNFLHGDKISNRRWYEMITRDFGKAWGAAEFRYGHKGHIHHHTIEELGGMSLESHQTLAAPDAWHVSSGYGAGRSASTITYHKDFGEYQRSKCSLAMVRS